MKVDSYNDFVNELNGRGDVFVFRGQANSNYILIPSGLREEHIKDADVQMFRFVDEMKNSFGLDELTCIEIAQHFSLPTRMLDFTYSYDVALFFACYDPKNKHIDQDGKVFILNKTKYEQILRDKNKLSSQIIRNNKFLYEWLQKYVDKKSTNAKYRGEIDMPIFVDATQQFDRLYMQKGLFLLWGNDDRSFESILEEEAIPYDELIDTIVIDKNKKQEMLDLLKEKHISEDTLYMNILKIRDLAKDIKEK